MTRTIYKTDWHCIQPGRWRSDCGWYEVVRCDHGTWIGIDLSKPSKRDTVFAETLHSAIWQLLKREK